MFAVKPAADALRALDQQSEGATPGEGGLQLRRVLRLPDLVML